MSWTATDYPNYWKDLNPRVRARAIDLGNELLESGCSRLKAIPKATARAKRWARRFDVPIYEKPATMKPSRRPVSSSGAYHVRHDSGSWRVEREGNSRASAILESQREALIEARRLASARDSEVVVHRPDGRVSGRFRFDSQI